MKALPGKPETRTVSAAEFKAKCLQLMDEINEKKLTLIVTKRGKPVMRASALQAAEETFVPLWGRTPGINVPGDITTALEWGNPAEKWKKANKRKKSK